MGYPSSQASNAIIYVTYGAFLIIGLYIGWRLRHQSKAEYLSSNRTQAGIPLALNFIASALGSGILLTYPQIATIAGLHGLLVYALASALPILAFGFLGPIIRRKCPEGFVLTEWTRQRFGFAAAMLLSLATLVTLFLYMVSELSALQQIVNALTGLNGLPAVIVQCVVTTIYTSIGGFKVSFVTDTIQGTMVMLLVVVGVITIGAKTDIDRSLVEPSGLLKSNLLGWQLIYILPVAIFTNDFFLSGFWLRTFASRTDRDLRIGVSIASFSIFVILTLVGVSGLLAVWSTAYDPATEEGYLSFFLLLVRLPSWVIGIVLVMVVSLSTAAFDSLQSSMVSSGSNDLFRNKLNLWYIRAAVVLLIIPIIVVALKSPDILQIYLITDLISASLIPVLLIGLWDRCYAWRGFEVIVGSLGGLFTVFLFGTVYFDSPKEGGRLLLLEEGLYRNDWSAFGAFVAAPVGALLWGLAAFLFRITILFAISRMRGTRFTALDKPEAFRRRWTEEEDPTDQVTRTHVPVPDGKFF